MTVFVDSAVFKKAHGRKRYCHLGADTEEELHAFAAKIGLKRHFFHRSARHLHYDLAEEKRAVAVAAGALEISSKELAKRARPKSAETQELAMLPALHI